jgi:SAM-dependent methyltransferase
MPSRERSPIPTSASPAADITFGGYYYAHDCGLPYERNDNWLSFFDRMATRIAVDLKPRSVLDAGCALGLLVEALRKRGVDAFGVDISEYAISHADASIREYVWQASLTEPLARRYDLVTCVEVLEHLPSADSLTALDNLCHAADRILLSSSPFDLGEATHVNVRQPEDWAAMLAARGFYRDLDADVSFLTPWAALYQRREESIPELVRGFERHLSRQSHELREVRGSVLALQSRLEEGYRPSPGPTQKELVECRDEIVGLEAELGEALGQVRYLDGQLSRYRIASDQLAAFTRSPVWRVYKPYYKTRRWFGAKLRRLLGRVR